MKKSFLAGAIALSLIAPNVLCVCADELSPPAVLTEDEALVVSDSDTVEITDDLSVEIPEEIPFTETETQSADNANLVIEEIEDVVSAPVDVISALDGGSEDASAPEEEDEGDSDFPVNEYNNLNAFKLETTTYKLSPTNCRFKLKVAERSVYNMQITDNSSIGGDIRRYENGNYIAYTGQLSSARNDDVFIFDPGDYFVEFYSLPVSEDEQPGEITSEVSITVNVKKLKLVSRIDVTKDDSLLAACPNSDDSYTRAVTATVVYADGSTEDFPYGKFTLDSGYSCNYDLRYTMDEDTDDPYIRDLDTYTGTAYILIWVGEYDDLAVTVPVTFISHTHHFTWEQKIAPTLSQEGLEEYICSCGQVNGSNVLPKITKFKLNTSKITLKKKQSTKKIIAATPDPRDPIVSWKSSNTKIVKVNKSGKITAQSKIGTAKITATTASGQTATVKVSVQASAVKTKKIKGVPKKLTLKKGKKITLTPELSPITSSEKIKYSSSNKKVAAVSASGKITAKKKGSATITIRSGSKKVTCKVKVN